MAKKVRKRIASEPAFKYNFYVIDSQMMLSRLRQKFIPYAWTVLAALGIFFFMAFFSDLLADILSMRGDFRCDYFDGCFQLYNPLRRLEAGQVIGADFNFFYGAGALWGHWPLFRLFGGNLGASQISLLVTSPLLLAAATFLFISIVLKKWRQSVYMTAILFVGALVFFPELVKIESAPMGVKIFAPLVVALLLLWLSKEPVTPRGTLVRWGVLGVAVGAALFISPDYGLAALASVAVTAVIAGEGKWRRSVDSVSVVLSGVASAALFSWIASGRAWLDYWRFHFVHQTGDQIWYFGVPPNDYLAHWWQLLIEPRYALGYYGAAVVALMVWQARKRLSVGKRQAAVFLIVFGIISTASVLGREVPYYFSALYWSVTLAAVVVCTEARELPIRPALRRWAGVTLITTGSLVILWFGVALVDSAAFGLTTSRPLMGANRSLGVNPSRSWSELSLEFRRLSQDRQGCPGESCLWSTYASLLEAEMNVFNPAADYQIHALGIGARNRYDGVFDEVKPKIVRTANNEFIFEPWLWRENWTFYERLVTNYDFAAQVKNGAFWTRREADWSIPSGWEGEWEVDAGKVINLPVVTERALFTLEVEYEVDNPWRPVFLLGNSPRYLLMPGESLRNPYPISLPPERDRFVSVVMLQPNSQTDLVLRVDSLLPGVSASVKGVHYRSVDAGPEAVDHMFEASVNSDVTHRDKRETENGWFGFIR